MTLGQKLKELRKSAGLTQAEMAEKLMVSRQAVTKWEADKGIPDIENIRVIADTLDVSIDYLLDHEQDFEKSVIRESIDLTNNSKIKGRNEIILERYKEAKIWPLVAKRKLAKSEKIIDNIIGFFTNAPFGVPELINDMKNIDKQYYLVEKNGKQFLVLITKEFMETRCLVQKVDNRKFEIGDIKFTKYRRIDKTKS